MSTSTKQATSLLTRQITHLAAKLLSSGKVTSPEEAIRQASRQLEAPKNSPLPSEETVLSAWLEELRLFGETIQVSDEVRGAVQALVQALAANEMTALVDSVSLMPLAEDQHYQPTLILPLEVEKDLIFFLTNQGAEYKFLPGKSVRLLITLPPCDCLLQLLAPSSFKQLQNKRFGNQQPRYLSSEALSRWTPLDLLQ